MPEANEYQHHSIWTPELVELNLPLAGVGRRCLGMLIDQIIIGSFLLGLWVGFFLILTLVFPQAENAVFGLAAGLSILGLILLSALSYFLYFWGFHTFNHGQTIGKLCLKTRLVTDRGGQPGGWTCFLRTVMDVVDVGLCSGGVGALMILMTPREKRIADFAAGTLVILDNA